MPISHLLEDFGTRSDLPGPLTVMSAEDIEDVRLGAFEQGYSAGWDDAITAQSTEKSRLSDALSRNLEDLSFTYHEAATQLTQSVEPVFRGLIETVFPDSMAKVLGQHIVDHLIQTASDAMDQPVVISVATEMTEAVNAVLPETPAVSVKVVADDLLTSDQATMKVGDTETDLDLSHVLTSVRDAVDAFFYQINTEARNG